MRLPQQIIMIHLLFKKHSVVCHKNQIVKRHWTFPIVLTNFVTTKVQHRTSCCFYYFSLLRINTQTLISCLVKKKSFLSGKKKLSKLTTFESLELKLALTKVNLHGNSQVQCAIYLMRWILADHSFVKVMIQSSQLMFPQWLLIVPYRFC